MPELIAATPLVVFDTETTGFTPGKDRVVEIGAIRRDPDGTVTEFQQLINPEIGMPKEAGSVNGIKDEMLYGMPKVASVLPGFLQFIQGAILVAHNSPFDVNMIAAELQRSDLDLPENMVYDTLSMAKGLLPGYANYKLQHLAQMLKLTPKGDAHRAIADSHVTMQLFDVCVAKMSAEPQLFHLHQYRSYPSFKHHGKQLFSDPENARRFGFKPSHFEFLKASMGSSIELQTLVEKDSHIVRLIGVVVDAGHYKKVPAVRLMVHNQDGEYRSFSLDKIKDLRAPSTYQKQLFG